MKSQLSRRLILIFVVVLLASDRVARAICKIRSFTLSGAELSFPINYVWRYLDRSVRSRCFAPRNLDGLFCLALLSILGAIVVALPSATGWRNQAALASPSDLFCDCGGEPDCVLGRLVQTFLRNGKMKLWTGGWLRARTDGPRPPDRPPIGWSLS